MTLPLLAAATGENIGQKVTNLLGTNGILGQVRTIVTPIAVLCVVFCGIKMLIASDPQSVKQAKSWLITIAIGLAVIWLAEPLVNTISSIANTN